VPLTASALAVVVVFAVCVADRVIAPPAPMDWPEPSIAALVVTVASVIAASAVSASVDPDAPAVPASA